MTDWSSEEPEFRDTLKTTNRTTASMQQATAPHSKRRTQGSAIARGGSAGGVDAGESKVEEPPRMRLILYVIIFAVLRNSAFEPTL
jgi:hypothetical protein